MPKKTQPKISVLVPCYNVEKFLHQCLDSIVNQTLRDIEIICINDGSTDKTLDIITSYAKHDDRIIVIDKPNEGYGKSMNRGLDAATGKYIGIVESDDWIDLNMFEHLVHIAEKNDVQVVKSNFYRYTTENGEENIKADVLPVHDTNCVINPLQRISVFYCQPAIWSAIYRRDFLVKNEIRFLESPGASFQDTGFNFKVWMMAKRVWLTSDAYLHYRCDNENSSVKSTGKIFCVCDEYESIEQYLSERNLLTPRVKRLIAHIKLGPYKWNLERLGGNAQQQFAERFAQEYQGIIKRGELERIYFDDRTWAHLMKIIYPKKLWWKIANIFYRFVAPIYKVRIRHGYKKYLLFGGITLRSVRIPSLQIEE